MVHDIPSLRREVHRWRKALGISQNEYARRAGVDPSILSRVLQKKITSDPAVRRMRDYNAKLGRGMERVS